MRLQFQGFVQIDQPTVVKFYIAGGSSTGGHCRLTVGDHRIGPLGDDNRKHAVVPIALSKGLHTINWEITGGLPGCGYLRAEESETGKAIRLIDAPVAVRESDRTVNVSSTKPGWPVPPEWTSSVRTP